MTRLLVLLAAARALAPTPITLLSGFLGAGKTTLLECLLKNDDGLHIGCLVNDVASLDVDGAAAEAASNEALVVTMSNGCACCMARDGLVEGVRQLRRAADFDHIVVEATGVVEPAAMRDALAACGGLDTLVTVVDASVFAKGLWATGARVLERRDLGLDGLTSVYDVLSSAGLWRGVADLLAEQVECANIILLNKVDAASDSDIHDAERICRALNPDATVHRVTRCDVPLKEVLGAMGGAGQAAVEGPAGAAFFAPTLARPPRLDAATHVYERDRPFSHRSASGGRSRPGRCVPRTARKGRSGSRRRRTGPTRGARRAARAAPRRPAGSGRPRRGRRLRLSARRASILAPSTTPSTRAS